MSSHQVKLGDRNITIEGFRAFRAIHAGEILSDIIEAVPNLADKMAEFAQTQREKNVVVINRATAEWRWPDEVVTISEAAWEASGHKLEISEPPTLQAQVMHVFPDIFKAARDHVLRLLALLAASNSELREWDDAGEAEIEKGLKGWEKRILHDAEVSDLIDLLIASLEVIREQFSGKADELGKLLSLLGVNQEEQSVEIHPPEEPEATSTTETSKPSSTEPLTSSKQPDPEPVVEATATPPTDSPPPNGKNGSSSATPPPSPDGPEARSSTESPGEPSLPLVRG